VTTIACFLILLNFTPELFLSASSALRRQLRLQKRCLMRRTRQFSKIFRLHTRQRDHA
jgi:hypothetical protein